MNNLKEELIEMAEIFDYYNIPEDEQRNIITSGLYFEFNYHDTKRLDCFSAAELLKLCKNIDPEFDANQMIKDLRNRRDDKYESLVKFYSDLKTKNKTKTLTNK
jgi:hypothetical protein